MKVLLVIGSARRGGAESQLTRLAVELRRRGVDCRVAFVSQGGPLARGLDEGGVPWRAYGYCGVSPSRLVGSAERSSWWGLTRLMALRRDMWRWKPDVVHAWLPQAVVAALLGPGREARVAAFRGQVLPGVLGPLSDPFVRAVRTADAITVNSPALIQDWAIPWGADPSRIQLIPNGVDVTGPLADASRQPPVAAVVANFLPYKGHAVLIDALALTRSPLTVHLYGAAGSPLVDDLRKRAADRGVLDRVTFREGVPDVRAELPTAQFAVHPSLTEGLSNAILEELAAGLPVVATDVGGNPSLITPGRNGELVPPGDATALAAALDRLAGDPSLRARLAAQARPSVMRYSWQACTDAHLDLYERLSAGRR